MAVAFDAQTASADFSASPFTFNHTPVGAPKGVTVSIDYFLAAGTATAVTYGGVPLAKILSVESGGANGENGRAEIWFVGSGLPTGVQTVSITHNALGAIIQAASMTVTAGADTELGDSDSLTGVVDDPQLALVTAVTSLRVGVMYSGHGNIGVTTALAGMTNIGAQSNGFRLGRHDRQTTPSSGSFTFGYTDTSTEEVALVVLAVQEAAPAVPTAPSNLVATALSTTSIGLVWDDNSSDETSFRVERSLTGVGGWVTAGTPAANAETFTDTGRTCATQYFYRVFAVNGSGDSTASNTDDATTLACPPPSTGGNRMGGSGAIRRPPRNVSR